MKDQECPVGCQPSSQCYGCWFIPPPDEKRIVINGKTYIIRRYF